MSAALGQLASTGGGRTVVPDTPHGPCPVVPRRAGQLTCTLHRGHGQASHALTRWNAPASLTPPPFLTLTRALCRHRSAQGRGQRAVRSWLGVTHRVASPGTATAGGFQVGAGCAGWSGIHVLTSVWCGLVGAWWLSGSAALTRCGWAVVTPFTGGAWPVQVGSPKFFLANVVIWPCRVPIPTRHPTAVWAITLDTDVQPETLACIPGPLF